MTDREKLTDEERLALQCGTALRDVRWKSLRIIDAHEADRAALVEQCNRQEHGFARRESALQGQIAALVRERDEALRSAESLRTAAHVQDAEVARLTEALELRTLERDEERKTLAARVANDARYSARAEAREAELVEARKRVDAAEQKLAAEQKQHAMTRESNIQATDSELEAIALLRRVLKGEHALGPDIERFLSGSVAEQKLAAAEQKAEQQTKVAFSYEESLQRSEARVRELEAENQTARNTAGQAESELAQLRERVERATHYILVRRPWLEVLEALGVR